MQTDPKSLQMETIEGLDNALNNFLIERALTTEQKKLMNAHKLFWENSTDDDQNRLQNFYNQVP